MDHINVSSSNVAAVGYDARSSTLEVEYKGGSVYQYLGVPAQQLLELLDADEVEPVGSPGEGVAADTGPAVRGAMIDVSQPESHTSGSASTTSSRRFGPPSVTESSRTRPRGPTSSPSRTGRRRRSAAARR